MNPCRRPTEERRWSRRKAATTSQPLMMLRHELKQARESNIEERRVNRLCPGRSTCEATLPSAGGYLLTSARCRHRGSAAGRRGWSSRRWIQSSTHTSGSWSGGTPTGRQSAEWTIGDQGTTHDERSGTRGTGRREEKQRTEDKTCDYAAANSKASAVRPREEALEEGEEGAGKRKPTEGTRMIRRKEVHWNIGGSMQWFAWQTPEKGIELVGRPEFVLKIDIRGEARV